MLIPGQNRLADPEIVQGQPFEQMLADFKSTVVDYIAESDAALADQVATALGNEAEVSTKLIEACVVVLQAKIRDDNEKIKQELAWWATGSNLDAKVADLSIKRQTLQEGDPDAFPPFEPVLEEDEHLRLRYFLAPHAPAAGSRMHYRSEILTLDERAEVSVETPEAGVVQVTYRLDPAGNAAKIKDGNGRMINPGTGEVLVTVLARAGDGVPDAALLDAVRAHFARPDVVPETDQVTVQAAEAVDYQIRAKAYIYPGPDAALTKESAEAQLQAYADDHHALGGTIEPSWIYHELHQGGAVKVELLEPLAAITTSEQQAPYCTNVDVEVLTL